MIVNKNEIIIYVVPGGALTCDKISGAVPFNGTFVNGVLYGDTAASTDSDPMVSVTLKDNHQLQLVRGATSADASPIRWGKNGDRLTLNDQEVVSCPDPNGISVLYAGVFCDGGKAFQLETYDEIQSEAYDVAQVEIEVEDFDQLQVFDEAQVM